MTIQTIEIARIDASGRLRPINPNWVATLAEELAAGEVLPPIEVVERATGFRLVAGGHRLAAHAAAGRSEIGAQVLSAAEFADEAAVRMREIKENMLRFELTALDRAVHLATWKEIYETDNTVDRRGGKRRGAETQTNRQDFATRFSATAATALDISERTVRMAVQVAAGLAPTVRARIAATPIADTMSELLQLSHQDADRQEKIVGLLLAEPPVASSVAEAIAVLDRPPRRRSSMDGNASPTASPACRRATRTRSSRPTPTPSTAGS